MAASIFEQFWWLTPACRSWFVLLGISAVIMMIAGDNLESSDSITIKICRAFLVGVLMLLFAFIAFTIGYYIILLFWMIWK